MFYITCKALSRVSQTGPRQRIPLTGNDGCAGGGEISLLIAGTQVARPPEHSGRAGESGDHTIASSENISVQPNQVGRVSRKPRGVGLAALSLRCRNYLNWHPVTGGFFLAIATAVLLTGVAAFNAFAMPSVNGWAICTPQNGIVLAFLLMTRRKLWPWIILGYSLALSLGARAIPDGAHLTTLEVFGNLSEVCLAAFSLPPFRNLKQWLQERRLLPAFLAYAMIVGPLLMALTVARQTPEIAGGVAATSLSFWMRVRTVALAEALGIALATSLVLVLLNRETYRLFRPRALPQTLAFFAVAGYSTRLVFQAGSSPLLLLVPVAILVITAFRLGLRAAVLATTLSNIAAVAWTLAFHGHAAATADLLRAGCPRHSSA